MMRVTYPYGTVRKAKGFLTKEGKEGYKAVPGMKVNVVEGGKSK